MGRIRMLLIVATITSAVASLATVSSYARLFTQSGVPSSQPLAFEVATIKANNQGGPGGFFSAGWCHGIDSKFPAGSALTPPALGRCSFVRYDLSSLIYQAYFRDLRILATQVVLKGPSWATQDLYDVEAKSDDPSTTTEAQLFLMLRTLLSERFKLQFHREPREIQGYRLLAPKGDSKLHPSADDGTPSIRFGGGRVVAQHATMAYFANAIIGMVRGPVTDATGLTGMYDFVIERSKEEPTGDPEVFVSDVEDQLGLRFERTKITADAVVIDHVEKPTAN